MSVAQIALIDDSPPFCLLVKQIFDMHDIEITTFPTSDEFFMYPSKISKFHLIMMDINLPGMDGLTAIRKLKQDITTKDVPVMLISGDSRKETVVAGIKLGACDFIMKPIDPLHLEERILAMLQTNNT
ncbi:response regulator [Paenibacillus eucommiae]|uniref:DNA-binding response OmpR family regulator n=1 Tax=Paenibacillus eucommiae TaxID=1355755 RepID=A0ABS4J134_9BACL|nr:response regulator [Paenibacillus eucommiae]MBP1993547.1 DNA-binding response OmpR family regulator [Paenibacillus eucommiae]